MHEDLNYVIFDGQAVVNEGTHSTVFIDKQEEVVEIDGRSETQYRGVALRVPNPLTRAKAIDMAERVRYGLEDGDAVASFNAALARKERENPGDEEVWQHDQFIDWVKKRLTEVGV